MAGAIEGGRSAGIGDVVAIRATSQSQVDREAGAGEVGRAGVAGASGRDEASQHGSVCCSTACHAQNIAGREVGNGVGANVHDEDVVAATAREAVVTAASGESVVATATSQSVGKGRPGEGGQAPGIGYEVSVRSTRLGKIDLDPSTCKDGCTGVACCSSCAKGRTYRGFRCSACAHNEGIVARQFHNRIGAEVHNEGVVAGAPVHGVVAEAAYERVVSVAPAQKVIARTAI